MKFVKTDKWVRLRGQVGPNNERCKLDTAVENKDRVFFVPETEAEKEFFDIDTTLGITNIPHGPTSHSPDEWGWRFYPDRTEDDMKKFADSIASYMKTIYEQGVASTTEDPSKKTILN